MPRYDEGNVYEEKPMPKFKKPNSKFPKDEEEDMDEALAAIDKGTLAPDTLSKGRKALSGKKLSRPRFGGMMVGQ